MQTTTDLRNATIRDLLTIVQYPRDAAARKAASAELNLRRLCGNCGSPNHTFCNR